MHVLDMLVVLAASLWSLLLLPRAGGLPQCSGDGVQCNTIGRDGLPNCAEDYRNRYNLEYCPYSYQEPHNIWGTASRPGSLEECSDSEGLQRNDCGAEIAGGNLNITFVPHNKAEANITVSWAALNLNIPSGSVIEIKLIQLPCTFCNSGFFQFCVARYLCTSNTSQTSIDIPGVKYTERVNAVQLAVVADSAPTTVIRTKFVDRTEDYHCTNPDIFQYDIERCPPRVYSGVRNLEAEFLSTDINGGIRMNISWLAPVEDDLFHASLHYHLTLTPLNAATHYFEVFPVKPAVSLLIGLSGDGSLNYSIGVRSYVDCSGCAGAGTAWENITIHSTGTTTTSVPTTTTSQPPTTTPTATSQPPTTPPTATSQPSTTTSQEPATTSPASSPLEAPLYIMVIPSIAVLVAIAVLITAILVCCIKRKQSTRHTINPEPISPPLATIKPRDLPYRPTQPGDDEYVRADLFYPQLHADFPAERDGSSLRTVELSGDEAYVDDPVLGEDEIDFRVLIVYAHNLPEAKKRDILSNLVKKLHEKYRGIKPICCDIVSMDRQQSIWLQQEVPKADRVLCVCTERSLQDWEVRSTMFGTLKMIIEAKTCKNEEYPNFAAVLLGESDRKFIPDLLQRNQSFVIDDLHSIVRYITGAPLYVLPWHDTKL